MKKSTQQKTHLTPNEVARLLMVNPVTVRQWASRGLLRSMATPGGHRRFQLPCAFFGQPDGPPPQILLDHRDFDQAAPLEGAQVARQGRLIEISDRGQPIDRIVFGCRDLRHQAELSEGKSVVGERILYETGDTASRLPDLETGTMRGDGFGILP